MADDPLYLMGTDGPDHLVGGSSNDALIGFGGDDLLEGLEGDDQLYGQGGADVLDGGLGDDLYHFEYEDPDEPWDTIIDAGGNDTIRLDRGFDLAGHDMIENLLQFSTYSGRPLYGNVLDNTLTDSSGGNRLYGREGNDTLWAAAGNDILIGGEGADVLVGGDGDDRFDFETVTDSGVGEGNRDLVAGFEAGGDRLSFGRVDANATRSGNQAFTYLGDADFTGHAGELHWSHETLADGSTAVTLVAGDVDGDGVADFEVELRGHLALSVGDFIL